ncbi:hypothetical protein MtrunA17_Chr3g0129681 [Medicago truncatula]|uniref:Uncharacterized protein n=1 Tax=Medicago truncatula TaxID=3880 RepID=A0A396IW12_MEDTR|nr:hypothetical protein MtrunA17_Chr3g0129681 [Medicago truncatula]
MQRCCFLQHMHKCTNSGTLRLSDWKEPTSFKKLSHITTIERFRSDACTRKQIKLLN